MLLVEIGTAGVISAYFYMHITSDPIERQQVQLSDYLFVFGCGLVFWLLVLLRAKLHGSGDRQADILKVAKLAKLIAPITTLNLCGCLLAPFMKLPLLVRFLVLFQVSSNLALPLIWAFLSLKECMILLDAHTQQQQKTLRKHPVANFPKVSKRRSVSMQSVLVHNIDGVGGKDDEARGSGSGHGSEASVSICGSEIGDSGSDNDGGGDRGASGSGHGSRARASGCGSEIGDSSSDSDEGGDRGASGSEHGSRASGSGSGSEIGDSTFEVGPIPIPEGGDRGASGSGHGSRASGSGSGSEIGDSTFEVGPILVPAFVSADGADLECGGRGTNTDQAFESSKITEMSLMLTAQTTAALIGFHLTTPSSSSKAMLVIVLIDQLVAYLCGLTSILLSSNKPEDTKAAKIFADIGFVCTALGFILMVAMFVPWYLVLIAVLLFGVVWLIFFRNGLKSRATEVWNYLKNSTQSIKNCTGMLFESGS